MLFRFFLESSRLVAYIAYDVRDFAYDFSVNKLEGMIAVRFQVSLSFFFVAEE